MPPFPAVADLKTGDLLFPRDLTKPTGGNAVTAGASTSAWSGLIESVKKPLYSGFYGTSRSTKMADLLKVQLKKEAAGPSSLEQWLKPAPRVVESFRTQDVDAIARVTADSDDLPIGVLLDLYKIMLHSEFKFFFEQNLNMTVDEFTRHPLMTVLRAGLARDVQAGFFVGHVGMVLREKDGVHSDDPDANVYIVEANASDFAHYRVAVHPYRRSSQASSKASPQEGWSNYHVDHLGRSVWHRRPLVLENPPDGFSGATMRQALVNESKKYQGRPYGFFENPTLGYIDRFYCSEFVNRVWEDALGSVGVAVSGPFLLTDRMRWSWLYKNRRAMSNDQAFQDQLDLAFDAEYTAPDGTTGHSFLKDFVINNPDKDFCLLTVHMLYRSAGLLQIGANPGGEEYN